MKSKLITKIIILSLFITSTSTIVAPSIIAKAATQSSITTGQQLPKSISSKLTYTELNDFNRLLGEMKNELIF